MPLDRQQQLNAVLQRIEQLEQELARMRRQAAELVRRAERAASRESILAVVPAYDELQTDHAPTEPPSVAADFVRGSRR
jgi:hypothetical protein